MEGAGVDQEMKAYLDEQFAWQRAQFARQGEQLTQQGERLARLEERTGRLEEESRQTRVLIEGVEDKIRLIAEGLVGVTERMEAHRIEAQKGFDDVKASIALPYQDLDRRVRWLEKREERKERDPFDVIHEEFGIPKKA
jgi:hypothetical protein